MEDRTSVVFMQLIFLAEFIRWFSMTFLIPRIKLSQIYRFLYHNFLHLKLPQNSLFQIWIFGDVWCSVWLAVDVWMCTASILNLCAISLDRYVAVTRPVSYPSIMSRRRAKGLIAGLWVLSFVICFPPLVGWKDKKVRLGIGNSLFYPGYLDLLLQVDC